MAKLNATNAAIQASLATVTAAHDAGVQTQTLTIPFVYEAVVVPPRCRKPRIITLTDTVDVTIRVLNDAQLPVAMKVKDTPIHWDGNKLFRRLSENHGRVFDRADLNFTPAPLDKFIELATSRDTGNSYTATVNHPFCNYWRNQTDLSVDQNYFHNSLHQCGLLNTLSEADYASKNDVKCREWVVDNRDDIARQAQAIADSYVFYNGGVYTTTSEPRYQINTFGMGNNHGGTGMFVVMHYNGNIGKDRYFNALQYDQACQVADAIAESRGDTKHLPVRPSETIEVYIPDAVNCSPMTEHGDGDPFINSIEASIQAAGPIGGMVSMLSGLSNNN